jgi:nucleotide-binding universal stress UspA family protein
MNVSIDRILVPVDGSEAAAYALEYAIYLAKLAGAALELVTVLELSPAEIATFEARSGKSVATLDEDLEAEVLAPIRRYVAEAGVEVTTRVLHGRVVDALLDATSWDDVSLVVMGRTGKGPLRALVEGSVSRGLAARCPVPVTIVGRPPAHAPAGVSGRWVPGLAGGGEGERDG